MGSLSLIANSITIENTLFFLNSAEAGGGAINIEVSDLSDDSSLILRNCTFYQNSSNNSGGDIFVSNIGSQLKSIRMNIYNSYF